MFWFFGREACGILAPRPGIELAPPALEGEDLTTGPSGKSQSPLSWEIFFLLCMCGQKVGCQDLDVSFISSISKVS